MILQLAVPTLFALKCETTWAAVCRLDTTKQLPCDQTKLQTAEQAPVHPARALRQQDLASPVSLPLTPNQLTP